MSRIPFHARPPQPRCVLARAPGFCSRRHASRLPRSRSRPASIARPRLRPRSRPYRATTSSATRTGARTNSAASGSYDGTIDLVYGGAPHAAQALGPFVYPTFITANVSGQVRQVPGAVQGQNIVREAWSTNDPYFWGSMGFHSNGGVWWPIGPSAILRVVAPIAPFRNDAGGQPTGDWSHCGSAGYTLCWTWAGAAHFDFQRIHVDLTLARSPDTTVWQGTSATFTAGMSQTNFPGNPYPVDMSALQWRWISDSIPSDSVACQSISGRTCTHVFTSSGTMYTAAYVNGEAQQKSMHVTVSIPTLELTAEKTILETPGDIDTFFPVGNGPVMVQGWNFTPDGGTGLQMRSPTITNRLTPGNSSHSSSPMPVRPPILSQGQSPQIGSPDHPHFSVSVGSTWADCAPSAQTCTNQIAESGTVEVIATVNGVQRSASVHVKVIPCPTKDSLLNDPYIRRMLDSLWRLSWPDTTNSTNRIERSAFIYLDSTTHKIEFTITPDYSSNTPCSSTVGTLPPGAHLLRQVHTHPARVGKYIQCDSSTSKRYADQFGKPSGNDWDVLNDLNNQTPGGGVSGWIIDQDEVITFDPSGVTITRILQPSGKTAAVPTNWRSRDRQYYKRRQPGCTLP